MIGAPVAREPLDFAGLCRQVDYVAGFTGAPGSLTALVLPDGPELLAAMLGAMRNGAAAPLSPDLTENELRRQFAALRPSAVILGPGQAELVAVARPLGIRTLIASSDPRLPAGVSCLSELWRPDVPRAVRELPPDTRLLLQTSGTSGDPKLVPLTGSNLEAGFANQRRCFRLTASDRFLCLTPLFHLHGFGSAAAQLAVGGSVICPGAFDPLAFRACLEHLQPTWYTGGPVLHRAVASLAASGTDLRCASLRFVRSSSAALESSIQAGLEKSLGVPFIDSYGLTETGTVAATPLSSDRRQPGSAGVSAGPEIAILRPDGSTCLAGEEGEIAVRGPNVIAGYLNDPQSNRERFRGGWFFTGDLGRLDANGFLFITGRLKDMLNRGGAKIMPSEIESALLAHPDVAEAAAFGVPHPRLGEEVEAAVVVRPGASLGEAGLREFAAARLASFKVPRRIYITAGIPRTSTGKPKRAVLCEAFASGANPPDGLPPSAAEARIATIWSRVLGCAEIPPNEPLSALGGDSLSAAIILAEVQAEFGCGSLVGFFDQPTVASLARLVAGGVSHSGSPAVVHLAGHGSQDPVFCVPATSEHPYYLRHLAARFHTRPFFAVAAPRPNADLARLTVEQIAREAVADIHAAHPEGPYILAGHCFGGVVAFEAARQMWLSGQDVPAVILLDTPTPGYPKVRPGWRRYLKAAWGLFREKGTRALAREASRHIRTVRRAPSPAEVRAADKTALIGRAMHAYVPKPLDLPVIQAVASELQPSTRVLEDARLGWRDFARAGFTVIDAPGDHHTFLLPPLVNDLARSLAELLAAPASIEPRWSPKFWKRSLR